MMDTIRRVVVVAGAQRSGTTLVGQILGAHPQAFLVDEPDRLYEWFDARVEGRATPELEADVLRRAGANYADEGARLVEGPAGVRLAPHVTHLVLKGPNLTHRAADFDRLGVPVSVVIPVRDPRAVVASMDRFRFQKRTMVERQIERIGASAALAEGVAADLAGAADEGLAPHVRGAHMWRFKLRLAQAMRDSGLPTLIFRYEDLVADPDATIATLAAHAGLSLAPEMLAHQTVLKGFGPGYTDRQRPVDAMSLEAWRSRIEPGQADEVAALLGDEMAALGYRADPAGPQPDAVASPVDAPIVLVGRGGSGTRLLSQLMEGGGVFLGNRVNKTGDSVEWADLVYEMALARLPAPGAELSAPPRDWSGPLRERARHVLAKGGRSPDRPWGWKLPETMLILPEVARAFPGARVIHLVRDPVTSSLRRTHKTSRPEDQIGRHVVPAAYEHAGLPRREGATDEDWRRNAVTWRFQVETVMRFGRDVLGPSRYLEVRYEDLCADPAAQWRRVTAFLGLPYAAPPPLEVDPSRTGDDLRGDPRADEVWRLCGPVAEALGYARSGPAAAPAPVPGTPEIVLHVGPPKTGTTSIQAMLAEERAVLARHGIEGWDLVANHGVPLSVLFEAGVDARKPRLRPQLLRRFGSVEAVREHLAKAVAGSTARTFVLSAEAVWRHGVDDLRALRDALAAAAPSRRIRVVAYAREPRSHVTSAMQQRLKAGLSIEAARGAVHELEYRRALGALIEVFGRDAVEVRPMPPADPSRPDALLHDALAAFGAGEVALAARPVRNAGLPAATVAVLDAVAADLGPDLARRVFPVLRELAAPLGSAPWVSPPEIVEGIVAERAADLDWLAAEFGIDLRTAAPPPRAEPDADVRAAVERLRPLIVGLARRVAETQPQPDDATGSDADAPPGRRPWAGWSWWSRLAGRRR